MKMISKIKSSKLANIKLIFGLLTAMSLVIVFACEQREAGDIKPADAVIEDVNVVTKVLDGDEEVFSMVEEMPQFPGGEDALRQFLASSVNYPEIASKGGIQGRVYVTFVVDKTGQVANAKIARGVDPSLDQEALRVVNSLPKWKPGIQRGEPVNVSFTVPINFALQ